MYKGTKPSLVDGQVGMCLYKIFQKCVVIPFQTFFHFYPITDIISPFKFSDNLFESCVGGRNIFTFADFIQLTD